MKKLWIAFAAVLILSFAVLGWVGTRIYQEAPPLPDRVVTTDGKVVIGPGEIGEGQNVWQSMGGMQVGSVWGHGSYVAPDWTAESLHKELIFVLDRWAQNELRRPYAQLDAEQQGRLRGRLEASFRRNTYDAATGTISIDPIRAEAMAANAVYYTELFAKGNPAYAIPAGAVTDPERARKMAAFFWWSSWAASTNRFGDTISYTHNWPHEPLVGNTPTTGTLMWSLASVILLLAAAGALIAYYAKQFDLWRSEILPEQGMAAADVLHSAVITPSMRDGQILLGGGCAVRNAGPARDRHRALRGGRPRALRPAFC